MRYHQHVRAELEEMDGVFLDMPREARADVIRYIRGVLIATNGDAVLPEPIPIRILGQERPTGLWLDVLLRDTIERAWHREDRFFGRRLEREG